MNNEFPQPLNQGERKLLVPRLNKFFPAQKTFLEQLDQTVMVGKCPGGCPTIHLWKATEEVPPARRVSFFAVETVKNLAGEPVGLLLFETDVLVWKLSLMSARTGKGESRWVRNDAPRSPRTIREV